MEPNPYDDFPYRSLPIEWTAPERLALASFLHGGPRPRLESYRVLEIGCGDGSNILPLAYYRPHARFVGIDGAQTAISLAGQRRAELALYNLELIHADFGDAANRLSDRFDFIIAHGVFSWVAEEVRDALFALCAERLRPGGVLYLNYNAKPGWNVRGLVREYLLNATAGAVDLASRAVLARDLAANLAASLEGRQDHPYTRLLESELRFVCESHLSYIAHEFLSPHNHPYWRSDFLALARRYGLEYVADADFNYPSGRVPTDLPDPIAAPLSHQPADARLPGRLREDTVDLLCYRQLHSPILTLAPWTRRAPTAQGADDLAELVVASCLEPTAPAADGTPTFRHPTGFEVEAKQEGMRVALERLRPLWPRGLPIADLFPDGDPARADLRLLYGHGLIDLRLADAEGSRPPAAPLNERERAWGAYATTPYHTREPAA